jgi:glycosyltransferase involved in cell wall biosynthesis
MKILLLIHSLSLGGAERVTANLANYWVARGWRVTVVTLAARSHDFYELDPMVERIGLNLAGDSPNMAAALTANARRVLAVRRVLKRVRPDVALAMMTTSSIILALASNGLRLNATIGCEHCHPPQVPLGGIWERLRSVSYRNLTAVVALTAESRLWLQRNTSVRRCEVIPNAVPYPLPTQAPTCDPRDLLLRNRNALLAAGRLEPVKGFDVLIRVYSMLCRKFPLWDLVILGEGSMHGYLEKQIADLGLTGRAHLAGRVGNVGDWYSSADVFVMSSRSEGFPNALVEAMACGLPAVSFDCDTGPRDIIRHGVDGLLVPAGDIEALVAALSNMMSDAVFRQACARRALDVRERFSTARVAAQWENLFDRGQARPVPAGGRPTHDVLSGTL